MNLYFTGHGEKYAVEQTLLTLFPQGAAGVSRNAPRRG